MGMYGAADVRILRELAKRVKESAELPIHTHTCESRPERMDRWMQIAREEVGREMGRR